MELLQLTACSGAASPLVRAVSLCAGVESGDAAFSSAEIAEPTLPHSNRLAASALRLVWAGAVCSSKMHSLKALRAVRNARDMGECIANIKPGVVPSGRVLIDNRVGVLMPDRFYSTALSCHPHLTGSISSTLPAELVDKVVGL